MPITANAITLPHSLEAALATIGIGPGREHGPGLITMDGIHSIRDDIAALAALDSSIHPQARRNAVVIASIEAAGGIVDLQTLSVSWPT